MKHPNNHGKIWTTAITGISVLLSFILLQGCGSSGSGNSSLSTGITLSGTIAVSTSDASTVTSVTHLKAIDSNESALSGATVNLYKIFEDGTETLVDTTTSNTNGTYSFSDVDAAAGGNGTSTDFYYEVRATMGDLDLRAPAAPTDDTTVDVTPESNLAAKIISDVVDAPNSNTNPITTSTLIEATRTLVDQNVDAIDDSINIPSAATTSSDATLDTANGIAAAGGNAEKMFKTLQFESEFLVLTNSTTATSSDAAAYIKRIIREGCNQPSGNPFPIIVANVLGANLITGTTYTPTQIVQSYNTAGTTSLNVDTSTQAFATVLSALDTLFGQTAAQASAITPEQQLALYIKRNLTGSAFTASTALQADQAAAFVMSLPGSGNYCQLGGVNIASVIGDLTGSSTLSTANISDAQIYNDSGFGCNGAGQGHFRADVDVFVPTTGVTVTSVTVSSTEATALDGDGTINLTQSGNRWVSTADGICVTTNSSVTYTITANLSDTSTVADAVTRNHPVVPEASTTVGGVNTSNNNNNPDVFTEKRPTYTWESPETKLAQITGAPTGSRVKYTYEFSHIDITDSPIGPLSQCNVINSGAMYEVDSFIPTVDCDPAACATATGKTASNLLCRMNIQTFLVDEADRLLGQAAGHFPVFCVDTNSDNDCAD